MDKAELMTRLRAEGRWQEASQYREAERQRLKAEGVPKAEARDRAWNAMLERFPPQPQEPSVVSADQDEPPATVPDSPESPDDFDIDTLTGPSEDFAPDLARDIVWVYGLLEVRRVKPTDAPSAGAWALLKWARQYRNRFFEQMLPKALAEQRVPEGEGGTPEQLRGERKSLEECAKILRVFNKDFEAKMLANASSVVQQTVASALDDWARRWAVALPDEARESLLARMANAVQKCAAALAKGGGA